jgi:WXXGXW repeat (2 copies)
MKLKIGLILAAVASLIPLAPAKGVVVSVAVGDRPYYVHGPWYYAGHRRYVWIPGHWGWRHHRQVWIHGHYNY